MDEEGRIMYLGTGRVYLIRGWSRKLEGGDTSLLPASKRKEKRLA